MLMYRDTTDYCYEELANAIVDVAATDYINALNGYSYRVNGNSRLYTPAEIIPECQRFFKSKWYTVLTSYDGAALQRKCEELAPLFKGRRKKYNMREDEKNV